MPCPGMSWTRRGARQKPRKDRTWPTGRRRRRSRSRRPRPRTRRRHRRRRSPATTARALGWSPSRSRSGEVRSRRPEPTTVRCPHGLVRALDEPTLNHAHALGEDSATFWQPRARSSSVNSVSRPSTRWPGGRGAGSGDSGSRRQRGCAGSGSPVGFPITVMAVSPAMRYRSSQTRSVRSGLVSRSRCAGLAQHGP